jgi:hypothetical protein
MKLPPNLLRPLEEFRRATGRSALTNLAEAVLADLGHPHFKLPAQDTDEGLLTREALAAYRAAVTREAPFQDILGPVHQTELTGQRQKQLTGQFFTPWSLAQMMAKMQLTGWTPGPAGPPGSGRFLWTVNEPALGCGGLLLAFCAEILEAHGPDGLNWWSCSGVDIDREVTIAAAAQFWMNMEVHQLQLGELVIAHGNTLSCECFGFYLHLYYPGLPLQLLTPFVPTPQGPAPIWLVRPPTGAAAEEPAPPAEAPTVPAQTAPAAGPDPAEPPAPRMRTTQLLLFDAA